MDDLEELFPEVREERSGPKGKDLLPILRQLNPPEPENVIKIANECFLRSENKRRTKINIFRCLIEGYKQCGLAPDIDLLRSKIGIVSRKKCNLVISSPGQIEADLYIKRFCEELKFSSAVNNEMVEMWKILKKKDRDLIDEKPFNIAIALFLLFKDIKGLDVEKKSLLQLEKKANSTNIDKIYKSFNEIYNSR